MNLIDTVLTELKDLLGPSNVLTDEQTAHLRRDWTGKWQAEPVAVLRPANTAEVSQVVKIAARHGLPIVPVGGNTGLVGGTANTGALMLSLERMNRIRALRPEAQIAVVEAGVILSDLHAAAEAHDLIFPLTFGAKGSARVGGILSTNAGGSNVVRYGPTRGMCLGLEVVLACGRVLDLMNALHKDNSGYDLRDLFIGAEGTLGIVTAAVLQLAPKPQHHGTALVSVADLAAGLGLLDRLQRASDKAVEAFEYMPASYMAALTRHRPDLSLPIDPGDHCLMIELGGLSGPVTSILEETLALGMEAGEVLDAAIAQSEAQRAHFWAIREAAAEITFTRLPIVDCDICLPLDRIAAFLDALNARLAQHDPSAEQLIVGHLGDGNLHVALYPSQDRPDLIESMRAMVDAETVAHGGSISAEHGVGLGKLATLKRYKDPVALDVMAAIKTALDPGNLFNPGKVLPGQTGAHADDPESAS